MPTYVRLLSTLERASTRARSHRKTLTLCFALALTLAFTACVGQGARPCKADTDCRDDQICVNYPPGLEGTCVLPETVDAGPRAPRDGGASLSDGGDGGATSSSDGGGGGDAGFVRADGGGTCPTTTGTAGDNETGGRCNDGFTTAETVEYGGTVNGTINAFDGGLPDRDIFRFNAASGDLVQITVLRPNGSTVQPFFVLYNADGDRYYNGPRTGAAGTITGQYFVDVGGTFYVEVSDLRHHQEPFQGVGGPALAYRLELRKVPLATSSTAITTPFSSGTITLPENRVLPAYRFDATQGTRIVAETNAVRLSPASELDTVLRLIHISGSGPVQVVDVQDDIDFAAGNKDARIDILAPATGTYVVLVDDIAFPEATTRTLSVTIDVAPPNDGGTTATSSAQLEAIHQAADASGGDGGAATANITVSSAVVTYVKTAVAGAGTADPAGFFVQSQASGPAVFVAVDAATLSPAPVAGDTLAFIATSVSRVNGLRRVNALTSYSRSAQGADLTGLMQNVSNVNFSNTTALDALESELVLLSGVIAGSFTASGAGFVSAPFTTFGTFETTERLRLRVPETLRTSENLRTGCRITLTRVPLWRNGAEAQPSAWARPDFTTLNCNADGGL